MLGVCSHKAIDLALLPSAPAKEECGQHSNATFRAVNLLNLTMLLYVTSRISRS